MVPSAAMETSPPDGTQFLCVGGGVLIFVSISGFGESPSQRSLLTDYINYTGLAKVPMGSVLVTATSSHAAALQRCGARESKTFR